MSANDVDLADLPADPQFLAAWMQTHDAPLPSIPDMICALAVKVGRDEATRILYAAERLTPTPQGPGNAILTLDGAV